jgi:GNAT superfamily N-acetyltransferase
LKVKPILSLSAALEFQPVSLDRWRDLEKLFGPNGACQGCWCTFWRLRRTDFKRQNGAQHKRALKQIVRSGLEPGLLAYRDGEPIGWCSIGPREDFLALENSRNLKRLDDRPVWSIVCFFIHRTQRRSGLTAQLLQASIEYARDHGATIVEAYPIDTGGRHKSSGDLYMGVASVFRDAGFAVVQRRPHRIMRYVIES